MIPKFNIVPTSGVTTFYKAYLIKQGKVIILQKSTNHIKSYMYHDVNFIIDLSCQSGNEHTKEDIQTQSKFKCADEITDYKYSLNNKSLQRMKMAYTRSSCVNSFVLESGVSMVTTHMFCNRSDYV